MSIERQDQRRYVGAWRRPGYIRYAEAQRRGL